MGFEKLESDHNFKGIKKIMDKSREGSNSSSLGCLAGTLMPVLAWFATNTF